MGNVIAEKTTKETIDYSKEYTTKQPVRVIKKDGSTEEFNVQKVINAVGKSAYRALTKFTEAEKRKICQHVIEKVDELESNEIPIPIMHNIVESALEQVKPIVAKSFVTVFTKIVHVLKIVMNGGEIKVKSLYKGQKRSEQVATFLALLELSKNSRIKFSEDNRYLHFVPRNKIDEEFNFVDDYTEEATATE